MTTPLVPGPGAVLTNVAQAVAPSAVMTANMTPAVLGDVADQARAVRAWISNRHNWVRVAWFLSGSVLFAVGAVMVGARPATNAAGGIVKTVKGG